MVRTIFESQIVEQVISFLYEGIIHPSISDMGKLLTVSSTWEVKFYRKKL